MRKLIFALALVIAFPEVAQAQALPPAAPDPRPAVLTLDTPIEIIVQDPAAAAVINRTIPGLLSNPSYDMFKSMSLRQVAALSSGRLTHKMLLETDTGLRSLRRVASVRR